MRAADPERHVTLLSDLLTRLDAQGAPPAARALLLSARARAKLLYGDADGTRTDMDAAWAVLDGDGGVGVAPAVTAAYYGVAADYYKVRRLPTTLGAG
jgi:26S proteasome regulatory subunit N9